MLSKVSNFNVFLISTHLSNLLFKCLLPDMGSNFDTFDFFVKQLRGDWHLAQVFTMFESGLEWVDLSDPKKYCYCLKSVKLIKTSSM